MILLKLLRYPSPFFVPSPDSHSTQPLNRIPPRNYRFLLPSVAPDPTHTATSRCMQLKRTKLLSYMTGRVRLEFTKLTASGVCAEADDYLMQDPLNALAL